MHFKQIQFSIAFFKVIAIFIFAYVFVFSASAQSETLYSGLISLKNSTYTLQIKNSQIKYKLTFASPGIEKVVQRLTTSDFISIQTDGIITHQKNEPTLNIISINFVGLNAILGTWRGNDKICYHFYSFTTFYVFNPAVNGQCLLPDFNASLKKFRKLNYFVNPDDLQWFLLISDKKTQYVAELIIKNAKTSQLNLYEQETGNTISEVTLRR